MNEFEKYLVENGIHFHTAGKYGLIAEKYLQWLQAQGIKPMKVKRSKFTEWLDECRKNGNVERTLVAKENVIKHYYFFLGVKNNPAKRWLHKKREYRLPTNPLSKEELLNIYNSVKPKSPADYRNRCMFGMVLFQGLKRSELTELRAGDVDFDKGDVFIQGQLKTNGRMLKLENTQVLHMYDYFHKYRKAFLNVKTDKNTDQFFLSIGKGSRLENAVYLLLKKVQKQFPQIENFMHVRGSVITNWQKDEGTVEAMVKAGHRYISSTQRFHTQKYDELQDVLRTLHPLESITFDVS